MQCEIGFGRRAQYHELDFVATDGSLRHCVYVEPVDPRLFGDLADSFYFLPTTKRRPRIVHRSVGQLERYSYTDSLFFDFHSHELPLGEGNLILVSLPAR